MTKVFPTVNSGACLEDGLPVDVRIVRIPFYKPKKGHLSWESKGTPLKSGTDVLQTRRDSQCVFLLTQSLVK